MPPSDNYTPRQPTDNQPPPGPQPPPNWPVNPQPMSPYDFIEQTHLAPSGPSGKKRLILAATVVIAVTGAGLAFFLPQQNQSPSNNSNQQNAPFNQSSADLQPYSDSSVFKLSHPANFQPVEADEDSENRYFYKDGNATGTNAFGIELIDTASLGVTPLSPDEDYTNRLKVYSVGQEVSNTEVMDAELGSQPAVKATADTTDFDGKPAKIVLVEADTENRRVTLWFVAEVSDTEYIGQIDAILSSFEFL